MRNLIIDLNRLFGVEHNTEITKFVNEQYAIISSCEGIEFSLHDVDQTKIALAVNELIAEFQLDVHELVNGIMLIPCMSKSKSEFGLVTEFRPAFIQTLLQPEFTSVAQLIKGEDSFEYYGRDSHLVYIKSKVNGVGQISAGFINGSIKNGPDVCIFMDQEEMVGIQNDYSKIKYNGTAPIYAEVWDEILLSSLYRRMLTEPMTELLLTKCGAKAERIVAILSHGKSAFAKKEFASDEIISSWGKPIAKKVILYTANDEKRIATAQKENLARLKERKLSIVVNNGHLMDEPASVVVKSESEEYATEWGEF